MQQREERGHIRVFVLLNVRAALPQWEQAVARRYAFSACCAPLPHFTEQVVSEHRATGCGWDAQAHPAQ